MGEKTKIAWSPGGTVSFWWGCTKCATGCQSCYAKRISDRFFGDLWGPTKPRGYIISAADTCRKLNDKAEREGQPRIVFVNSMSDFFEDHAGPIITRQNDQVYVCTTGEYSGRIGDFPKGRPATLDDLRREAFKVFDECPWLRFMLLTKRPENIPHMWLTNRDRLYPGPFECSLASGTAPGYRFNVQLGTSISNQEDADKNVPELLKCRDLAPVLFVSYEPALGPVDFDLFDLNRMGIGKWRDDPFWGIDQVIIGVESDGPRVGRLGEFKTEKAWIESAIRTVAQCREAGVAVFVKQIPHGGMVSHDPACWPAELNIREFPTPRVPGKVASNA